MAADRPSIPSLARSACAIRVGLSARGKRTPNTTARPRIWFLQHDPLADQLLADDDQRANSVRRQRFHVYGLEEAGTGEMRQTTRIVAVGLVGSQRLQRLRGLAALDTDNWHTAFG